MKILITGATGNIGTQVIRFLVEQNTNYEIVAGIRNEKDADSLSEYKEVKFCIFDFENPETFDLALDNVDILFLLRPPHLSDIEKYFRPLISKVKEKGISKIVFLSVQGAELSKIIPHNKIETLIKEYGLEYIFLRPAYFMQNLTTRLLDGIKNRNEIVLPAGKANFNWVDTHNIGEVVALAICKFDKYKNEPLVITGKELLTFTQVAAEITRIIGREIEYKNVNPISFFFKKRKEGLAPGFIIVMIVLHFLPRFQSTPKLSDNYKQITGKEPTILSEFIEREKELF